MLSSLDLAFWMSLFLFPPKHVKDSHKHTQLTYCTDASVMSSCMTQPHTHTHNVHTLTHSMMKNECPQGILFILFPSLQALDGRVERDDLGKEKRFPVLLTAAEKLIARKVVLAFKVREGWGRWRRRGRR